MEVNLLSAKNNQISGILEMMAEFNATDSYPFDKKISKTNLIAFLNNSAFGKLWTIQLENKVIGYLVLTFGFSFEYQGRDAFIDELFLKEEFRNQGIGKVTMELLEVQARKLGINAIHLEVESTNQKGKRLYDNQGYESNGRTLLTKRI